MKTPPPRLLLLLRYFGVAAWVFVCVSAPAHSDPVGDIHPQVAVENGRFAVYFENNEGSHVLNQRYPAYRMIYEKDRSLAAPRHGVKEYDRSLYFQRGAKGPDGADYVFPGRWSSLDDYRIEWLDGTRETKRFRWPELKPIPPDEEQPVRWHPDEQRPRDHFYYFNGATVTESHIALFGTDSRDFGMQLAIFRRGTDDLPVIVRLGPVSKIYSFPTCSNLVFAKGRFRIAWMRWTENAGPELVFASISPKGMVEKKVLDLPGFGNSTLSLGVIDDRICLAYHYDDYAKPSSRIITWFETLD